MRAGMAVCTCWQWGVAAAPPVYAAKLWGCKHSHTVIVQLQIDPTGTREDTGDKSAPGWVRDAFASVTSAWQSPAKGTNRTGATE